MSDKELADVIIARLNAIVSDPEIRADISNLIETRIQVGSKTAVHPSIQVQQVEGQNILGFLGLLNGIVGTIPEGNLNGWGYIAAVFSDDGHLEHFRRTDVP